MGHPRAEEPQSSCATAWTLGATDCRAPTPPQEPRVRLLALGQEGFGAPGTQQDPKGLRDERCRGVTQP